jgi:hypothetical protein
MKVMEDYTDELVGGFELNFLLSVHVLFRQHKIKSPSI